MDVYLAGALDYRLMDIYCAGAYTGNNRKLYDKSINIHTNIDQLNMSVKEMSPLKLFFHKLSTDLWKNISLLESFYYIKDNKSFPILLKNKIFNKVIIDSGAFTFMKNTSKCNWDEYIQDYAEYINKNDIDLFFELDIDSIIGLDKVEKLRERLYSLTGKKAIPVWHKNRGKEYFIEMCKKYPYVAIGGIVTKEIPKKIYEKMFPWFISTAHKYNAKIHGLGYTTIDGLKKYHFDSVDSTSWLNGNIGGYLYKFNAKECKMEVITKENSRIKGTYAAIHNFNEWLKLQDYARKKL